MNTCIRSTFKCSFEVFKAKVMEDKSQWSKFVDDYQIAMLDEHNSIMVMNVLDFEAMKAFMTTDDMKNKIDRLLMYIDEYAKLDSAGWIK